MTYRQLLNGLGEALEAVGEEREALEYAFKEKKSWTTTDFVLNQAKEVTPDDQKLLKEIFDHLKAHKPVQHYLGYAYFKDLTLTVSQDVLIPRPETEELVDLILSKNPTKPLKVLDIGTGSGAIALALKNQRLDWQVTALDISKTALEIAKQNGHKLGLTINWLESDVFSQVSGMFDIIVSNPPYISEDDKEEVGTNVLLHEPHGALFAPNDGFAIYQQIIEEAPNYLSENGQIYFEIGYKQARKVKEMLEKTFPNSTIAILKDLFGKDRMVVLTK
ncbi:peptide chain release factor N(5)-glutamine methyltransferase [Streptococcus pluranimalium]|uniref:peptide chain release factor N(5)-glutamine methyltransferase n=1 Tax=Streptococcus pluranimalium TaxID=82348 RepID=UPI0024151B4E|nr:peptide chain release factor N(5)-glutamine methyltransferase [Streptococcus pluranimalium]WFM80783.1 peptide chain release factor N(5)-glutamine methyltransferase [Streptococcus pluranimalium]